MGRRKVKPRAGDVVRVKNTDDSLIEEGSYGVIGGQIDKTKKVHEVTFNPYTPYRDDEFVNASGGPVRGISSSKLESTGEKKEVTFWKFDGLPRAGGGKNYQVRVNVFEVDLGGMKIPRKKMRVV